MENECAFQETENGNIYAPKSISDEDVLRDADLVRIMAAIEGEDSICYCGWEICWEGWCYDEDLKSEYICGKWIACKYICDRSFLDVHVDTSGFAGFGEACNSPCPIEKRLVAANTPAPELNRIQDETFHQIIQLINKIDAISSEEIEAVEMGTLQKTEKLMQRFDADKLRKFGGPERFMLLAQSYHRYEALDQMTNPNLH